MTAGTVFALSAVTMFALWIATFVFTRRRQTIRKKMTFYLGAFLVWPASAGSLGLLIADHVLEGIHKPVSPGAAYSFAFALVATLAVWLAGHSLASLFAWFFKKPADRKVTPIRRERANLSLSGAGLDSPEKVI